MIDAHLFDGLPGLESFCWMLDAILTTGGGDILLAARGGAFRFDRPIDVTTSDPAEDEIEQHMEDKYHIYQNPGFAEHVYLQARRAAERFGVAGITRNDNPVHGLEDLLAACKACIETRDELRLASVPVLQGPADVDRQAMEWDVFISHASEDKEAFVRPLAIALQEKGIRVWFDELTLTVGESLRRSIDRGLASSRYGIVVISPDFFKKEWPQKELDGLFAQEVGDRKVILPVWHNVDDKTVQKYLPLLAGRYATLSAKGVKAVVADLMKVIK